MPNAPFFTVIVPAFNAVRNLGGALNSLTMQSETDWQAIILNDWSTNEISNLIQDYCRKDNRFRSVENSNGGMVGALNSGMRAAKGEWICQFNPNALFHREQLARYRRAITKSPQSRFFVSNWRCFNEETTNITDKASRNEVQDERWQILNMLRMDYLDSNSICINRNAWLDAGDFDSSLGLGQDYDVRLRLITRYPASFVPESICVRHLNVTQSAMDRPGVCLLDSGRAAIAFLNHHRFPELVPLCDLKDPLVAKEAIEAALDIAEQIDNSILYALGPHSALLMRILEWAWNDAQGSIATIAQRTVRNRAECIAKRHIGSAFGFLWKAVSVVTSLSNSNFTYESVSPMEVAEHHYWDLEAHGDPRAEKVRRYLDWVDNETTGSDGSSTAGDVKEVIFVNQLGMTLGNSGVYGTLRAALERAKYLMRNGVRVVIVGVSDNGLSMREGVLVVGVKDEESLLRALDLWGRADTVIGLSRGDFLKKVRAKRVVVYHHNSNAVQGFSGDWVLTKVLNWAQIPIICVSHFSKDCLVGFGVSANLVHVVPNGVDRETFCFKADCARPAHSLIFAGHMVDYKGIDIALRAFALLRLRFPDATFDAYGQYFTWCGRHIGWNADTEHVFKAGWLDKNGFLVWEAIERELPGFHYRGEVPQQELARAFRTHSILIMPSRVTETFGLVSLEAQAGGCIPVAPRQGGFPETMREGITGYLYETNTPDALAAKVSQLWEQNLPAEAQRVEAQAWVREACSWEKSGKEFLRVLEAIPNSKKSRYDNWFFCFNAVYLRGTIATIADVAYGLWRRMGPYRRVLGLGKETFRRLM